MKPLACWIAAACLAAPSVTAALDASSVRATTLSNGLVVLLAPDSKAAAADVSVWYRAGTRHESRGSGLAHLFGRLMFGGTRSEPSGEHRRVMESLGATVNSLTNPDYITFHQTLPSGSIERALELEAARMASLAVTEQGLDRARRSANEERDTRLSLSPVATGLQRLYGIAFEGHPYARPVIGSSSELARLSLADVESHHRARYSPDQAVLAVVGDFDPDAMLETVRRHFERLPRRPHDEAAAISFPEQKDTRRATVRAAVDNRILMVGWRAPGIADPDSPAMDALAEVLTGGIGSRLRVLGAKRFEYQGLEGGYDRTQDASLLFGIAGVAAAADSEKAEAALVEAMEILATEPVQAEELDRAKRRIAARTWFSWQTARGRAEALGAAQLLEGDARKAFERLDRIERLTPADLQRVAARALRPTARSVVWIRPGTAATTGATGGRR